MAEERVYNILELPYPDVQEFLKEHDVIMVPIGSCEQHGLHLPIGCDSIEAMLAVEGAARKAGCPHTPILWFGYSPQHMRGPGTGTGSVTVRTSTYHELLYDVGRSLIHHGWNKIVFVTGHTSNIKVADTPLRRLRYTTGALACLYRADSERTQFIPEVKEILECPMEETPGWHGSELETSACLLWNEKNVHQERYEATEFTHAPAWFPPGFTKRDGDPTVQFKNYDGHVVPMDHHEYSDTGLVGNPFAGTREKGEKIFDWISTYLAAFLEELKKVKVEVHTREWLGRA